LHPVAIHVGEPQLGDRRTARALIDDAAAVEGVVERLWPRELFLAELLPDPAAPHLAIADPDCLAIALLDVRRPVSQRRRQPGGPQIRRQLAEIHVVVAGDQVRGHDFLLLQGTLHGA
jgi:hypothetical protein